MKDKKIAVIGGGTGIFSVLVGLKQHPVQLSAIVSMADDGGSTKILREEFGILPPGSVRPALTALAEEEELFADLFTYRFEEGSLKGHSLGNLVIAALAKKLGSFEKAIEEAHRLLRVKGQVIPSTLDQIQLVAELENGALVYGESNIDIPKHDGRIPIRKLWLQPKAKANPRAVEALQQADLIILGPGDLYTSVIPNLLVPGIAEAVRKSKAKKAYVCNLTTKFGETTGFEAKDFLGAIEKYLGKDVLTHVLCNTKKPSAARMKKYEAEHAEFVPCDAKTLGSSFRVISTDLLRDKGFIRHDPQKLAKELYALLK